MNINIVYLLIAFIFFSTGWANNVPENISAEEKLVNKILEKSSSKISKTYQIKRFGEGASMPSGIINTLNLHFLVYRSLTHEESRKLLLCCVYDFLEEINSHPEIAEYASFFPFNEKNIKMTLYIRDSKGHYLYSPWVSVLQLTQGNLDYYTRDKKGDIDITYEETYQEALEKVKTPS